MGGTVSVLSNEGNNRARSLVHPSPKYRYGADRMCDSDKCQLVPMKQSPKPDIHDGATDLLAELKQEPENFIFESRAACMDPANEFETSEQYADRVCQYAEDLFSHSADCDAGVICFNDMREIVMEMLQCFKVKKELTLMILDNLKEILQTNGYNDQLQWRDARVFLQTVSHCLAVAKKGAGTIR